MDLSNIPLGQGAITGATWLWEKYGSKIIDICAAGVKEKWTNLQWRTVEEIYRNRLLERVGTTLLLGYPKPISIENIYTDVHILTKLSAKRRFKFDDLKNIPYDFQPDGKPPKRVRAEDVVENSKRVFILGKPGAGKTTFLKHLAILACRGKIEKTPIYVSLKEWADSGKDIHDFIEAQFAICGFPAAKDFIKAVFGSGDALILLDGLDEVNQEGTARIGMIHALENLAAQYPDCTFCLTCRIAAVDYSFTQFTYIEIADFSPEQKLQFVKKWYGGHEDNLETFQKEWNKSDNKGLHDLAQTPLLLALLCLVFDELLHFPKRRVELYEEALDALLKKWDSSRGISRSETYRRLSLGRKKQLLSRIAASNFQAERYLMRKEALAAEVTNFLHLLPRENSDTDIDPESIILAIESQHGLLVERAHRIYSFSHLTLQEYFTAKYIVDHIGRMGVVQSLLEQAINHPRWREVALMCSSMQGDATTFLEMFAKRLWDVVSIDEPLNELISILDGTNNVESALHQKFGTTAKNLPLTEQKWPILATLILENCFELAAEFSSGARENHRPGYTRARKLATLLQAKDRPSEIEAIIERVYMKPAYMQKLADYLRASKLLVECLKISTVEDRPSLANMVLRPLS